MAEVYILLFFLIMAHLAISTVISLEILYSKPFNKFPKAVNIILTWLIPFYWNFRVWYGIRKVRVVDPKAKNTPLWEILLSQINPFDIFR